MTLKNYKDVREVSKIYTKYFPEWRIGQSFFNILAQFHPEISEVIIGTDKDMFFKDDLSWEKEFKKTFIKKEN
jgi:hypothetical protein